MIETSNKYKMIIIIIKNNYNKRNIIYAIYKIKQKKNIINIMEN